MGKSVCKHLHRRLLLHCESGVFAIKRRTDNIWQYKEYASFKYECERVICVVLGINNTFHDQCLNAKFVIFFNLSIKNYKIVKKTHQLS